jgi:hypothetical protein
VIRILPKLTLLALIPGFLNTASEPPRTIVDLQPWRKSDSVAVKLASGRDGLMTLTNLNPYINVWHLLELSWRDGAPATSWHLENPKPREARILLDPNFPPGIVIAEGSRRYSCSLVATTPNVLEQARASALIYYPLCEGRVYLRNPAKGRRSALESATEFLRDQIWGGEKVIAVFHHLMADRYRETSGAGPEPHRAEKLEEQSNARPANAVVNALYADGKITPANMGVALEQDAGAPIEAAKTAMTAGAWYRAAGNPGVYVSVMEPDFIAPEILKSYPRVVNPLDRIEAPSLSYLIAFDLTEIDIAWASGTDHPRVDWSSRAPVSARNSELPGPDGIGSIAPLISTGLIRPDNVGRTIATFTGGFKRTHGAFRYGDLAARNNGSHYGFVENGVVFSRLQPGLATVFVLEDGSVGMKTWLESDNALSPRIKYARQNGVPLVEFDRASGSTTPGNLVARWGPGNWSGSEDEKLRTIRAGLALQEAGGRRFLIYAVFSDATPSAMARVFQAYRFQYAMLLDMNALEHTYFALYRRSGGELSVDHLLKGMNQLDKSTGGAPAPRFLGFPDNRDFFYVMRREPNRSKR